MLGDTSQNVKGLYLLAAYDVFSLQYNKNILHARQDAKNNVNIIGLSERKITSVQQIMQIIQFGINNRVTSQNSTNNDSSRSHAILQILLKKNKKIHGKISFIDLAGSQRAADHADQTDKQTRIDGAEINKSLLALKQCIRALDQNKSHLPFRGSKLTMVLKDSFTGYCKSVMIGNISPNSLSCQNTLNTLKYADRVKQLKKPNKIVNQGDYLNNLSKQLMLPRQLVSHYHVNKKQQDNEDEYQNNIKLNNINNINNNLSNIKNNNLSNISNYNMNKKHNNYFEQNNNNEIQNRKNSGDASHYYSNKVNNNNKYIEGNSNNKLKAHYQNSNQSNNNNINVNEIKKNQLRMSLPNYNQYNNNNNMNNIINNNNIRPSNYNNINSPNINSNLINKSNNINNNNSHFNNNNSKYYHQNQQINYNFHTNDSDSNKSNNNNNLNNKVSYNNNKQNPAGNTQQIYEQLAERHQQMMQKVISSQQHLLQSHENFINLSVQLTKDHITIMNQSDKIGSTLQKYLHNLQNNLQTEIQQIYKLKAQIENLKYSLDQAKKVENLYLNVNTNSNHINEYQDSQMSRKMEMELQQQDDEEDLLFDY